MDITKKRPGPVKGMKQDIHISLIELIRQLPSDTLIPVRGKWAKEKGVQVGFDVVAHSKKIEKIAAKVIEIPALEVNGLNLKVMNAEDEFND